MPVYGMVHGAYQNGFFAVVDSGAEYTTILATPAQTNNPYNWAAARFEFRQKYVKNINRKEGSGANVPQETPNELVPRISFYFLEGQQANYDGMAVLYRQQLLKQGILTRLEPVSGAVPLQLEVLGADKKESFLFDTTAVFTTAQEALQMVQSLQDGGITELKLVYRCCTRNNECGEALLGSLGSLQDFQALEQAGAELAYYLDPITANADQITPRTEAANNLSRMEIRWSNDSRFTRGYPDTYLYRLSEAEERIQKALERDYGGEFALAQMSGKLYGDFTSGKEVTRAQSLSRILAMTKAIAGDGKIAMYEPNQYLWPYADKMYDLPTTNSQILYETDSVPFLQIVLSGCVEMYGGSINTSSYSDGRLLRQIEYGMAPAFTVTGCQSIELFNTPQELYYSTCFADWEGRILQAHRVISQGLSAVWGRSIVSHRCLQTGVVRVEYEGGICIYLNYTDGAVTAEGVSVPAGGFTITGR